MNKFDRVVSILTQLQSKKIVKAQDLADKFDVSLRTIYRDLRSLEYAGVPLHAEAGVGYSLVDGYSLPPVMLTEDEATSFLVAEKLVEKMTDASTASYFNDAVNKVKAVLKSSEKAKIDQLNDHIIVAERFSPKPDFEKKSLQNILESIISKRALEIEYEAAYNQQVTKRKIEPLGVHYYSGSWHLIAWCRLRKAYRDFRIDRIKSVYRLADIFELNHPNLSDYMQEIAHERDLKKVIIRFDSVAAQYARSQKYYFGFVKEVEEDEYVEIEFLSPELIGMAHWLLTFTNQVDIVEPNELKAHMTALTKELMEKYLD